MSAAPSQSRDKSIVRRPDGMRGRIKACAQAHRRSMNAQIIARIEESLDAELGIAVIRLDILALPEELYQAAIRREGMARDLADLSEIRSSSVRIPS